MDLRLGALRRRQRGAASRHEAGQHQLVRQRLEDYCRWLHCEAKGQLEVSNMWKTVNIGASSKDQFARERIVQLLNKVLDPIFKKGVVPP